MGYEYTPHEPSSAAATVKPPAVTLIVISTLGALFQLYRLTSGFSRGVRVPPGLPPDLERLASLLGGPLLIASAAFGVAASAFIIFGAVKMMALESYSLAMAAATVASIPCISPCCCLGMIPGIWSLTVLTKPQVKAAFR